MHSMLTFATSTCKLEGHSVSGMKSVHRKRAPSVIGLIGAAFEGDPVQPQRPQQARIGPKELEGLKGILNRGLLSTL